MRIQSANIVDSNVILKLFSSLASFLEEVRTKPNLFQVSLMGIFC